MKPSFHEDYSRRQEGRGGSDRSFGIVAGVFLLCVGLWPLRVHHGVRLWALALAVVLLAIATLRPLLLHIFNRAWTRLGLWIGLVTTPLITAALFFLAVTPTAVVLRLLRKDPLRLRLEPGASSYWIERRPPGPAGETMRNQF